MEGKWVVEVGGDCGGREDVDCYGCLWQRVIDVKASGASIEEEGKDLRSRPPQLFGLS
jgi:hypothetical protein